MADITRFDLMQIIGTQMALFIESSGNGFKTDLAVNGKDLLVTSLGDINVIKNNLSCSNWIDDFIA